jgi:hypothetical protein
MAQQLYFSRDTKVYIEIGSDVWEMPVLDGFSFSQATNVSEITLSEMEDSAGNSKRGKRAFNDSLAPAEWSFSTYVRPFVSAGTGAGAADTAANHHAVEEVLWALMAGDAAYASSTFTGFTADTTDLNIDFDSSNKSTLGTASIYFVVGNANKKVYKLRSAVVNEATLNFEIDGIAMIDWSGFAAEVVDDTATGLPTATIYEDVAATDNFIRNRLTQLTVEPSYSNWVTGTSYVIGDVVKNASYIYRALETHTAGGTFATDLAATKWELILEASYNLTLTGGNITVTNNITYITPEELGVVNIPIGHVTGGRAVSGSFTCYLLKDTAGTNKSSDFFEDVKGISSIVTNSFGLTFKVGGTTAPSLELAMGTAHIDIPTHSIEDVISLETNFNALPSSIELTDEVVLTYKGA